MIAHMNQSAKVSVIMPVYNGGDYFEQAILSVLNQTYENIEIIIINDGSTDSGHTDAIGCAFQKRFPEKIRYFHQENTGVSGALNKGIENMAGQYFCWLSHDDLYLPTKIERQIASIAACGKSDIFLFGDWEYIGPDGEHLYDVKLDGDHIKGPSVAAVLGGAINGCTVMISRSALGDSRFDPQYRCVQDYRLWFELAQNAIFVRHPEVLVRQRLHPGQDTNRLKDVAIKEGEALWHDMIFGTSQILRAAIDGSNYRFLRRMGQQLTQMPYPVTGAQVLDAADRALDEISLTIVVIGEDADDVEKLDLCINSETDSFCQIIVVNASNASRKLSLGGRRISCVVTLQQALDLSEGEYVCFMRPRDGAILSTFKSQAKSMSETGVMVSIRSDDPANFKVDAPRLLINTVPSVSLFMVHRYLIASGELSGADINVDMPGNCLRLLSTRRVLVLNAQGEQALQ